MNNVQIVMASIVVIGLFYIGAWYARHRARMERKRYHDEMRRIENNEIHVVPVGNPTIQLPGSINHQCNHPGCTDNAIYEAVYHLRSTADMKPDVSSPLARLCYIHAHTNLWQKFYDREKWFAICKTYDEMNRARPKTKYSSVQIQPIGVFKTTKPKIL